MSGMGRKMRRQLERKQQSQSTEGKMSTQAESTPVVSEKEERKFTKAQARHFNQLQADVSKAQTALNQFIGYLGEEHEIEMDGSWGVNGTGFVREVKSVPPPPPPPDDQGNQAEKTEPIQE